MSTENLLRAQSADRLSASVHSSSVYLRTNSQQSGQKPQRKEGLHNPGFEGDFLEDSHREHSSSSSVFKRSISVPQVAEGKNIDDAGRKQVKSTNRRSNYGSLKTFGLKRQRPKTTSGQDLRRKAFINSSKLGRARSASYLLIPDESYEDALREHSAPQEYSKRETNERSIRPPQNSQITKEKSLQHLSKSVEITENENSQLREYSRRLSVALEERARLNETLHVLSRSVSLVPDKERELPDNTEEKKSHSVKSRRRRKNTPLVRNNSFKVAARPSRRLPETPLSSGHRSRGAQKSRCEPHAQTERTQNLTEDLSVSSHCEEDERERKKRAVAKLAEDLWRCHIHGETFQTNDRPHSATLAQDGNTNGQATADWRTDNLDMTTDPNEADRTKLRREEFRKQTSFQDDQVSSVLERRPAHALSALSRDSSDGRSISRHLNEETTQLGVTKRARSNIKHEERDRRALHSSLTKDQCANVLGSQNHDVWNTTPLYPQPQVMFHDRYYKLPRTRTQTTPSQKHQRGEKQEGQQDTSGQYPGDVDKERVKRENNFFPQRIVSQGYNGCSTSPSRDQPKSFSSNSNHINNDGVDGNQENVGQAYCTEQSSKTKVAPELPFYDISLLTKRTSQADGYHGNGCNNYKTTELTDVFMTTEDQEERRELQQQAAGEAAVLRREASNLLWKAMDLERICDQNARVRHVFIPH